MFFSFCSEMDGVINELVIRHMGHSCLRAMDNDVSSKQLYLAEV